MITPTMRKWLESLPDKPERTTKYCVYMNRLQKRIALELDQLLWLCRKYPDIFLGDEEKLRHSRLKTLLLSLKALNPNCDVELVLSRLDE